MVVLVLAQQDCNSLEFVDIPFSLLNSTPPHPSAEDFPSWNTGILTHRIIATFDKDPFRFDNPTDAWWRTQKDLRFSEDTIWFEELCASSQLIQCRTTVLELESKSPPHVTVVEYVCADTRTLNRFIRTSSGGTAIMYRQSQVTPLNLVRLGSEHVLDLRIPADFRNTAVGVDDMRGIVVTFEVDKAMMVQF